MSIKNTLIISFALSVSSISFANETETKSTQQEFVASPFQVVGASVMDQESLKAAESGEEVQCYRQPAHGTLLKKLVCRKVDNGNNDDKVMAH